MSLMRLTPWAVLGIGYVSLTYRSHVFFFSYCSMSLKIAFNTVLGLNFE